MSHGISDNIVLAISTQTRCLVKADWKLDFIVDKTGAIAGIKDLHSQSEAEGFMNIAGKGHRYRDW